MRHFEARRSIVLLSLASAAVMTACDEPSTLPDLDAGAPVNECASNNGGCDPRTTCADTPDGFLCGACPSGFLGDGLTGCLDVNECLSNNGGCGNATQYTCSNNVGAAPTCADLNECVVDSDACPAASRCLNSAGSFSCVACDVNEIAVDAPGASEICDCAPNHSRREGVCSPSCGNGRYFTSSDTVFDSTTDLEWERNVPHYGNDVNTLGFTWDEAAARCSALGLAGGGWRMPTRDELAGLVDATANNPAINTCAFPGTSTQDWFWTSTKTSPTIAYYVYFGGTSQTLTTSTNIKSSVRCVR